MIIREKKNKNTQTHDEIVKWHMKVIYEIARRFFFQFAMKRASTSLETGTSSFYWRQKPWVRIYLTDYNKART